MKFKRLILTTFVITVTAFFTPTALAQVLPVAEITPDPLIFPDTRVGTTAAAERFTVTKTESVLPLYIFSVKLANTTTFAVVNDGCSGVTLHSGETCPIDVTFTPGSRGHYSTTLSIIDLGRNIIDTALIEGLGVAPAVTLSTTSIDFGDQTVNKSSAEHEVLLTNSGNTTLTISSIQASGNFTQTNNCGTSVDAKGSCDIGITFDPTQTTSYTGTVTITDDAADSPQTISLSGRGINPGQPDVSLSTYSLDFGNQQVGTTSQPKSVTLTNTGTANLNINAITPSANYAETDDCGAQLVPDAECTIDVTFAPQAAGSATGTLLIDDDATDSPQTVNLTGQGTQSSGPQANLSTNSMDFGQQTLDTPSDPQTATLTNGGDEDLVINSVVLGGDDTHSYSEQDTCHGSTIVGGGTCDMAVTFTPADEGTLTATITITDNAGTSPQIITLTGEGMGSSGGGGCSLIAH